MPVNEGHSDKNRRGSGVDSKTIGKFILWGTMALIGWSFITTSIHDRKIAVNETEIKRLDEKINIDQRLGRIEDMIKRIIK